MTQDHDPITAITDPQAAHPPAGESSPLGTRFVASLANFLSGYNGVDDEHMTISDKVAIRGAADKLAASICDEFAIDPERIAVPSIAVEIGGQVMTEAQFNAARFPLLNPFTLEETPSIATAPRQPQPIPESDDPRVGDLLDGFTQVINRVSRENVSNTPDFILASIAYSAIFAYEQAVHAVSFHEGMGGQG